MFGIFCDKHSIFSHYLQARKYDGSMSGEIKLYLNFIRSFCPEISEQELFTFSTFLGEKKFGKKDIIFSAGQVQKEIGFISNGLVRSFVIDKNDNERTIRFHVENAFVTHYVAFITQQPSKYTYVCLEPTTIVTLSYDNMHLAYNILPSIQKYGRIMAEEILKMQQYRIESFLFLTAEERYLDFTRQNPDLFNRVSLSHLSSYLGIERQTLTRIRQKLAGK
jgi:CRP/FNR family transcriptional regulator, anaerobic regulatory protein